MRNVTMSAQQLGDVIVIPRWDPCSFEGQEDGATLLRVTDEPAFAAPGFRNFHHSWFQPVDSGSGK